MEKINKIKLDIDNTTTSSFEFSEETLPELRSLSVLTPTTIDEVRFIVKQLPNSALDPLPTWLLKECVEELAPLITLIINKSLEEGTVPVSLKHALVTPILKKDNLDSNVLSNYRPVSNLSCLVKILEKVVNKRLLQHVAFNNLDDGLQSAYRKLCYETSSGYECSI